ncbi:UNVERIFIED_CONTAM: hypothetical protein HHA_450800 [Hammondia hammondi]|eukprot:XP_008883256.1 hypothetical protein HHA_450800 [Hammondia hammondi]
MDKRIEFGPFPGMTEAGDAFRQPAVTELASDGLPTQRQRENLPSTGCPIMHRAENPCAPSGDAVPKACPAPNVLEAALKVLSTTDKGTVPVAKLVEFFWPPLSQQRKALLANLSREVKKLTDIARARGLPMPVVDVSCLSPDLQKIVSSGSHGHDGQGGVSPQDMNNLLLDISPGVSCDKKYEGLVQSSISALVALPSRKPLNTLKEWYAIHGI